MSITVTVSLQSSKPYTCLSVVIPSLGWIQSVIEMTLLLAWVLPMKVSDSTSVLAPLIFTIMVCPLNRALGKTHVEGEGERERGRERGRERERGKERGRERKKRERERERGGEGSVKYAVIIPSWRISSCYPSQNVLVEASEICQTVLVERWNLLNAGSTLSITVRSGGDCCSCYRHDFRPSVEFK